MQSIDLNLLVALDALLSEASVTRAAERMNLSPPAMSRTLARIRHVLGDPVLVRAGRALVPTPRAEALRPQLRQLIEQAQGLLHDDAAALATSARSFGIRCSETVAELFAAPLLAAMRAQAPGISLRFMPEGAEDVGALRDGAVDLDIGLLGPSGPEIRVRALFSDRFVVVLREGHALLGAPLSAAAFAAAAHIAVSRRGRAQGPVDRLLAEQGLRREVVLVVPSMMPALRLAAESELLATVSLRAARWAAARGLAIRTLELPWSTGQVQISQSWHPRFERDPAHRCLRDTVQRVCGDAAA